MWEVSLANYLFFAEGTLRAYCQEVDIDYQDSMVNWGPITEEQKSVFAVLLSSIAGEFAIRKAVTETQLIASEPKNPTPEDVPNAFEDMLKENITIYESMLNFKIHPVPH